MLAIVQKKKNIVIYLRFNKKYRCIAHIQLDIQVLKSNTAECPILKSKWDWPILSQHLNISLPDYVNFAFSKQDFKQPD